MATKYVRIKYWDGHLAIRNMTAGKNLIRDNFNVASFKVKAADYSNGDAIQFRVESAYKILFCMVMNATTGALETLAANGSYVKSATENTQGQYITTDTIGTAVELNVVIGYTISDESGVTYATVETT